MRARIPILFAVQLTLAAAAGAIPPPWVPLGPYGGVVRFLTADPTRSGTVYAATDQGVFKTADGGASWMVSLLEQPTSAVAVDPAHPSTLYVGVGGGELLLKSTDGGAHWAPSTAGLIGNPSLGPVVSVAIDPSDSRRLLVVYRYSVWRSVDAGASWQPAADGLPVSFDGTQAVSFAARPAGTAFAATSMGLYRTPDAGLSWRRVNLGLPHPEGVSLLALAPSDARTLYAYVSGIGLFRTTDGGFSWRRAAAPSGIFGSALAVSPGSSRTLYSSGYGGALFRSTDGGAHWSPLHGVSAVGAIAFDAAVSRRIYASSVTPPPGGVWRSDDGGASWTLRSPGLTALAVAGVGIEPVQNALWTASGGTVYLSSDRGASWSAESRLPTDGGLWTYRVRRIAVNPPYRLYAQATRFHAATGLLDGTFLWRSSDDGHTWELLLGPSGDAVNAELFDLSPSTPADLYALAVNDPASGAGAVLRSTDGGTSWQPEGSPGLVCVSGALAVAPSSPEVLYAGGSGQSPAPYLCHPPFSTRVARSNDGGATWTDASNGLPLEVASSIAVDPRDPDVVYVGIAPGAALPAGDGVWKSTDGGRTWSRAGAELAGHTASALLASTLSGRIYAVIDGNRVFRSDDGGASWQGWSRNLHDATIFSLIADPSDPRRIYAATSNGVWTLMEND